MEDSKIKNFLYFIGTIFLHLIAIGVIIYAFLPIAIWYLGYRPLWGVDFFLTPSLANLLSGNFVPPFAFWNYAWFSGWPQLANYPLLLIYLVAILTKFYGLIASTQILVIAATILFFFGSYFLFFVISRNILLALILTITTVLSSGIYQTLTWAGSLPSYTAQAFFPWVLAFLYLNLKSGKIRYLLASALLGGILIWVHQQVYAVYILPAVSLLIFLSTGNTLNFIKKIKIWLIFIVISIIVGLPQFYSVFGNAIKQVGPTSAASALSTTSVPTDQQNNDIQIFQKNQVKRIVTDNHPAIFYISLALLILYLISIIISRRVSGLLEIIPIGGLVLYFVFFIWIFGQGITIYHGGWYRLFWSIPVLVGMLSAALFYQSLTLLKNTFKGLKTSLLITGLITVLTSLVGFWYIYSSSSEDTIKQLVPRSQASSAHPDIVNLDIDEESQNELKKRLVPDWINGESTDYRIYNGDQTVNLWWNSLFKMPLARGYLDPPLTNEQKGYIFWLDSALSESNGKPQLVEAFNYPIETAVSNALFLIDWNAIRYFEGGHTGWSYTPVPKYLKSDLVKREEVMDLNSEKYTKRPVTLNYFEFNKDFISPILSASNASTIGIFGSDSGYEAVIRAIAENDNLNSQKVVPIKLGKLIDDYDLKKLDYFDALYLYDYDYKNQNKTFKILTNYVKSGKKIFIETGVEVKQSEGDLPELFPVKKVVRKGLGKSWNFEKGEQIYVEDVNVSKFSPPVFDDDEWKLSFANTEDLRSNAKSILKNHGKIVLATQTIGSGEVIWSGLNFAYHVLRNHNLEEATLFNNLLSNMINLSKKEPVNYSVNFINANNRTIKSEGAKGILFKEQAYDGWEAIIIKSDDKKRGKLDIFKAGPAYPGFMYIPIPEGNNEVKLSFGGSLQNKLLVSISIMIILFILDEVVLSGLLLGKARRFMFKILSQRVGSWWGREDE